MMKRYAKRAGLLCMLLFAALMLSGCVSQIEERELADLSGSVIEAGVSAPQQDGADVTQTTALLYFLSGDTSDLVPVARRIAVDAGAGKAEAALSALLAGPQDGEEDVFWPALGVPRSGRFLEVSDGVATVDLPAHARTLSQEMLYAVRMAIAATLTEFPEISYVNVLIGGREEGLDLGATLPVGTFSRTEDLDAGARYSRLNEQRQSGSGVTLLTTMYFPSEDGAKILPEVRSVSYAQVSPIEYLYTLLDEMGKGANGELAFSSVPAPMDHIEEMPEIVRTEDGYLAVDLRLSATIDRALREAELTRGIYLAMLTDTLMGFVPGVEGLRITIDSVPVTGLAAEETPDGKEVLFDGSLATRSDFAGYLGAPAVLYAMEGDGLKKVSSILAQDRVYDPRTRMEGLMALSDEEDVFTLPHGLSGEDILAVHVSEDVIAVNLSGAFARALSSLSHRYERAAVYAMVNSLTESTEISRVVFFFEGEQVESLAGGLEMRGSFTRNPGMVVN